MSLVSLPSVWVNLASVLQVVIIKEVLNHVERLIESGVVLVVLRGVLDQVLQGQTVLLNPSHGLVQQVLHGETLALLLALQGPELDAACEVSKLWVELAAPVESLQGGRVVAQELGVHLGLLGQHLEVVADLLIPRVPLHLLLQALVEMVVELVELGDLEEDHVEVFLWYDGLGGGQSHFHRLHVLETDTEALEIDRLTLNNGVQDVPSSLLG